MSYPRRPYPLWRYGLAAALVAGLVVGLNVISLSVMPEDLVEGHVVGNGIERVEAGDVDAVNIGGSTGWSLRFSEVGMSGIDFSYGARDLLEAEALAEVILARQHGLKRIFLAAGPLSLLFDNAWSYRQRRRQYYRILAPYRGWRPIDGDWSNLIQGRLLPLVREDRWRGPIAVAKSVLTGSPRPPILIRRLAPEPLADTADDPARLVARKGPVMALLSGVERSRYFEYDTHDRVRASLVRLCTLVRSQDLELVIYAAPVTDIFLRETAPYMAEAKPSWDEAAAACRVLGARIYRFDTDPSFHQAYRLFDDTLHLNAAGATAFSRKLIRTMEQDAPATEASSRFVR